MRSPNSNHEALDAALSGDIETVVERLAGDHSALLRLVEEHRIFREAIERSPVAYCVYDADNRLVASNAAYARLHPSLKALDGKARRSVFYGELVRLELAGQVPDAELEPAVAARVEQQRHADGKPLTRRYGELGYYRLTKFPLSNGAVAGLAFDINELKQREAELTVAKAEAEAASQRAQAALELERQRKLETRLLAELGEWLQSCKSLNELYQVIGRFMARLFPRSSGELYIYSNSRDVLDGVCSWGRGGTMASHFQPDECWALRRGRLYRCGAGLLSFACGHAHDIDPDDRAQSYLCLPINAHGDTVGLLHIRAWAERAAQGGEAAAGESEMQAFAIQCSEQISLAVANIKLRDELRDQSTRDPLTGLYNRRHFFERCRHALNHAARSSEPVGVISLDADHFKRLNDAYGHDAGDVVLRNLGAALAQDFNGESVAARLGGEEFSILLPGNSPEQVRQRADELRRRVENMGISYGGVDLPRVTISVGWAVYPQGGSTVQELLKTADQALYEAKASGRNLVCPA
jgi:diguanylate cyclase (GGDEF)-like protein